SCRRARSGPRACPAGSRPIPARRGPSLPWPAAPAGCRRPPRRAAGRRWKCGAPAGAPSGARPACPCPNPALQAVPVASITPSWKEAAPRGRKLPAPAPTAPLYRIPAPRLPQPDPPMPQGTLLYAQSGGVTAVINATASAVITEARARKVKVLAARNGILGALREELIDTTKESAATIRALAHT